MNKLNPEGFTSPEEAEAYDAWFRASVQEALDDPAPTVPHEQVMADVRRILKREASKPE